MPISTDLSQAPYYDDANNALADNYHRILFRPQVPVQARELTQLQDILQNQIERFGDNIFVTGTIIKGCNFSFDSNYNYVKVKDLRPVDGQPVQTSSYVGLIAHEPSSNLYAICFNYQDGYESQDPDLKTLYFKYITGGTSGQSAFSPGSQISFYQTTDIATAAANNGINPSYFANADVTIASTTGAVGQGYAMTVSSGIIFQKGHFIQVAAPETVIIDKYSQYPDATVAGFLIEENIVTELQDTNLLDNATGYSNYKAPGAHRLQLLPQLVAYTKTSAPANNFFVLAEWEGGNLVREFQDTQYSVIGDEMARRTYEEAGNFVVRPFNVTMQPGNTTHNFAVVSAGLAYVGGHRIEQLNNVYVPVRKGNDQLTTPNQSVQTNWDNSVYVGEFVGNIPTHVGPVLSLRDTAGAKISNGQYANGTPAGNEIGTAKTTYIVQSSGTIGAPDCLYKLHLTDIRMNLGKSFNDVKAVHYNGGTAGNAHADIAKTYDSTANTYIAALNNPSKAAFLADTKKKGIINLSQSGNLPQYIYRTIANTTLTTSGNSSLVTLGNTTTFAYANSSNGQLSVLDEPSIVVVPTSITGNIAYANVTLTKSGNLVLASSNTTIIANGSTSFNTDYQVGDYIAAGGVVRRITAIANSTQMTVDKAYTSGNTSSTHSKCYPVNVPINISQRNSRFVITDTAQQNMRIDLVAANGSTETLSANMNISVHFHAKQPQSSDRNLNANTRVVVDINTSNNINGTTGPWCLGIPHVYNIRNVYKSSNTGTLTANLSSGNAYILCSTSGFSNGVSLSGVGIPAGATANVVNSTSMLLSSAATTTNNLVVIKWAYYSNSANDDVTSAFSLKTGQRDAIHDLGFIKVNPATLPTPIANGDLLTIVFDAFKPFSTGKGYIAGDSYTTLVNSNTFNYESVPSYVSKNGDEYFLRDSIDFRPFAVNTAVYTNSFSSATINPPYTTVLGDVATGTANTELYVAAPTQNFNHDVYHYSGRIDKIVLNSYGDYQIVEGKASDNPVPPADVKGAMTLATIAVPPYPSYVSTILTTNVATSYSTAAVVDQNRVYTMRDIGKLDKRVQNLEYYTSLNLLEQQTSSLTIASSVTGANRFKNGIFVDNFQTTDMLDTANPEYKIGLSTSETALVPIYNTDTVTLRYGVGSGTTSNGGIITLAANGSESSIISQIYGTETLQAAAAVYTYTGQVVCHPKHDPVPDSKTLATTTLSKPSAPATSTSNTATLTASLSYAGAPARGPAGNIYWGPLVWSIGAVGYGAVSISISGPNGYTYTKTLIATDSVAGKFAGSGFITDTLGGQVGAGAVCPGTYTLSVTRTPLSGYTEGAVNINANVTVSPVTAAATPDTAKGTGITTGALSTIITVDRTTAISAPVLPSSANSASSNGLIYIPSANGINNFTP